MMSELPAAYAALAAGDAPALPPLQASCVDFAMWERGRLEDDGALAPQLAYWKQHLAGALQAAPLRGDLPGAPGPGSKGGNVAVVVPADLVRSLRSLAIACGATLYVVVLAAFKARPGRRLRRRGLGSCMGRPGQAQGVVACAGHCHSCRLRSPAAVTCCAAWRMLRKAR